MTTRAKFDKLRAQILQTTKQLHQAEIDMAVKYGARAHMFDWTATERKQVRTLRDRKERLSDRMFNLLEQISPRQWTYGIAAAWVCEQLTYEDAVRPASESLVATPEKAYGF